MTISIYESIERKKTAQTIPFDLFLDNIRSGFWQDLVIPVRAIKDKKERQKAKERLPNVTISGIFPERKDSELKAHSGLIAADLDNIGTGMETVRNMLATDPYVYAIFTSVSGTGLCAIFKIESDRHYDAFQGIADYLIKKYQLLVDSTGINPSRARYVSFDPFLRHNPDALTFKKYLPKEKKQKPVATIFVKTEFDEIVKQMVERNVSCVEDYRDWLKVSFGLADHFGEAGRSYFHSLSACSNKYDVSICDKQFDQALKRHNRTGIKVTIATIYYYAKEAGINITSETTKKIAAAASSLRKSGLDKAGVVKTLEKFEGITPEQSETIVQQVFESNTNYTDKDSLVDNVLTWLRHSYDLRRNVITRRFENKGVPLDDVGLNSMYIEAKRVFSDLSFELFTKCIFSNKTIEYNPFTEWYDEHKDYPYNGEIDTFFSTFTTDDNDKLKYFGTKWLVSIISAIYGQHSYLVLVLAGEKQKTGKTETFRRLLPPELHEKYYAESKLDGGKDDDILMTQKLIIMDDEFGGKSKVEQRKFKELTSKAGFSIREPYGRAHVDLKRLAVLCGTTNELNLLNDPTGNRRIIPVQVRAIDHAAFNAIDKTAIFAELFRMYHAGFDWRLSGDDVDRLNERTEQFIDFSTEYELINEYYALPSNPPGPGQAVAELTTSEIKVKIEAATNQRVSLNKLGQELKRIGFNQVIKKVNRRPARVWQVIERQVAVYGIKPPDK